MRGACIALLAANVVLLMCHFMYWGIGMATTQPGGTVPCGSQQFSKEVLQAAASVALDMAARRPGGLPQAASAVAPSGRRSGLHMVVPSPARAPSPLPAEAAPPFVAEFGGVICGGVATPDEIALAEYQYQVQKWGRREDGKRFSSALFGPDDSWPCFWGKRVIGQVNVPDGNKWLCGFGSLRKAGRSCVVYSFGSSDDTTFEQAILSANPDCAIRVFDPTTNGPDYDPSLMFVKEGLHGREDGGELRGIGKVRSLRQHMKKYGDDHIDVLKIDIEESEWSVLEQLKRDGMPSVGQVAIEVHLKGTSDDGLEKMKDMVTTFAQFGLRLAHREVNVAAPDCCGEYLFVQQWWHPEVRRYPMDGSRPAQRQLLADVGETEGLHCRDFGGSSTLHSTMVRSAERAWKLSKIASLPEFLSHIEPNFPCLRGTHEMAAETPICGLRETKPCVVQLANSRWYGPHLKKALLAINPSCNVDTLQVRLVGAQTWRNDGRCGPLKLLPDRSAPARCQNPQPCCSRGAWCGTTPLHCKCGGCIDYRNFTEPPGITWHQAEPDVTGHFALPADFRGPATLSLLQVDVDGWEWEIARRLISGELHAKQAVLEFHGEPDKDKHRPEWQRRFAQTVEALDGAGYRLYSRRFRQRHLGGVQGDCQWGCLEAAFVKAGVD